MKKHGFETQPGGIIHDSDLMKALKQTKPAVATSCLTGLPLLSAAHQQIWQKGGSTANRARKRHQWQTSCCCT